MAWRFFAREGQSIIINREAKKEQKSSYVKYATIYFNWRQSIMHLECSLALALNNLSKDICILFVIFVKNIT